MHAVQGSDQGRLTATRGADEGCDGPGLDNHADVLNGFEVAVVDIQVLQFDALGHSYPFGEKTFEIIRATMFKTITISIRVKAPAQLRSI